MIKIITSDITSLTVDAIVNAANRELRHGGGVCGAIFKKAGIELDYYCNSIKPYHDMIKCETGDAVITPAFGISNVKYIIHAVGPIYIDGYQHEDEFLKLTYVNTMKLANSWNVQSIAFSFISSGIYGYPLDQCAKIAMQTLNEEQVKFSNIDISICAFSDEHYNALAMYNE